MCWFAELKLRKRGDAERAFAFAQFFQPWPSEAGGTRPAKLAERPGQTLLSGRGGAEREVSELTKENSTKPFVYCELLTSWPREVTVK